MILRFMYKLFLKLKKKIKKIIQKFIGGSDYKITLKRDFTTLDRIIKKICITARRNLLTPAFFA